MNESLGRRIYNSSLTNADPKDLSAFGSIDEIYDLGRNREYSYSWGENSDYGNWLHTINRDGIFFQYDPLTLGLNGNGLETLAANDHDGAMFDHERLGIRTATGWVHGNDGILVYDRNGDGKINNGGELFGDNTLLKDGSTAAHGFAALAELDENGDGKVDAADSAFDKLGVWRDLNHNGISEEGEISSLADVRMQSLNLAYKNADQNLGNGNTLAEVGSYTDADGNEHAYGRFAACRRPFPQPFQRPHRTDRCPTSRGQPRAAVAECATCAKPPPNPPNRRKCCSSTKTRQPKKNNWHCVTNRSCVGIAFLPPSNILQPSRKTSAAIHILFLKNSKMSRIQSTAKRSRMCDFTSWD
ncbi:hypothetical protein [uncultured Cardiobacterium sp.]|uniref:hypothetical protein n=1 Tax=uncultured Cardiobacterium sp. TaxID=417619 RepID=UPI002627E5F8|nr:hypothetical protein [uncultured Cardiobacterium sp.]